MILASVYIPQACTSEAEKQLAGLKTDVEKKKTTPTHRSWGSKKRFKTLGLSDLHLIQIYRQKLKTSKSVVQTVRKWMEQ